MDIKVKISAIDSLEEANDVVSLGADIAEIIVEIQPGLDPRSKSKTVANNILDSLKGKIETSILTDKIQTDELLNLIDGLSFNYLFPIFNLENNVMKKIKEKNPYLKIVPTIHVLDKSALDEIEPLNQNSFVDLIHLDSRTKNKLGGTGQTHDWSISQQIVQLAKKPVILAGGLKPENVREAVQMVKPWGVDTYSGVLNEKRELDMNRVKQFIQNAKY